MSNFVTTYVYRNSKMTGAAKFLLVCIAEIVNDDGIGYAKLKTLQERTGMSRRWVQYNLRRLELADELIVFTQPQAHHWFWVLTDTDPEADLPDILQDDIKDIKHVPGNAAERRLWADYENNIYRMFSDKTRHAINNRERHSRRGRPQREDTPQEPVVTDTPPAQKKRGKGR